ncbi:MAG: hypothetical protein R3Y24_16380 [Eubacteriales bacterium]
MENLKLVDIRNVKIDSKLSKSEKMESFVEQVGDYKNVMCGDVRVTVSFIDTEVTLEEKLVGYFKSLV